MAHRLTRIGLLGLLVAAIAWLASCDPTTPDATATPIPYNPTQGAVLLLTPTTLPIAPIEEGPDIRDPGVGVAGASNPTQAALPAEGEPPEDLPTSTPQPTLAHFPMQIGTTDGLLLQASYYSAAQRPAPGVLLLHDGGSDRSAWTSVADQLQRTGYAVLAIDLRGYGATGGTPDWTLAQSDAAEALAQLGELPGVAPGRLAVVGAGIGANLGLKACANTPGCLAAVLLSPGLDYLGITTPDAIARMGTRPVLIATSENDDNNPADSVTLDGLAQGDHRLLIYPEAGHGMDMLQGAPELIPLIAEWLASHVPPTPLAP